MRRSLAWVVVLTAAACGDDGGSSPDAADHDAVPADAEVPDADPSGPVTITVTSEGNPIPGIDVLFSDPAGAEVSIQTTDAQGRATEVVLPGSAATIAVMIPGGAGNGYAAISWLGVEPGDDLVWQFDPPQPTVYGDLSVTLPGAHGGATSYELHTGCGTFSVPDPGVPATGALMSDCLGSDTNIDVLAYALDSANQPIAYSHDTDVPAVSGGTTSVTLGAWQTTFDPLTVTLTGAPAAATGAGLETTLFADGIGFAGPGGGGGFTAGTATLQSGYPTGFAERLVYSTFIQLGPNPEDGVGALLVGHPDTPATDSRDLATLLLPAIGSATAANAQGRLEVGWTSSGAFDAADGILVMSQWIDGADNHLWFLLAPPGATNPFQLPVLPDDLAAFRPTASSVFDVPSLFLLEADFIDGYPEFREVGYSIIGDGIEEVMPATGGVLRASIGGQLPGGP
jgi:hypothetical protein